MSNNYINSQNKTFFLGTYFSVGIRNKFAQDDEYLDIGILRGVSLVCFNMYFVHLSNIDI